jgi:hypothetical protein
MKAKAPIAIRNPIAFMSDQMAGLMKSMKSASGAILLGTAVAVLATLAGGSKLARAQDLTVTIKDHKFQPAELQVPAKKRFTVFVVNDDPTPEEFESASMKIEKIIAGKSKGVVRIGPLDPGRYEFFGDFNQATAQGIMIAE